MLILLAVPPRFALTMQYEGDKKYHVILIVSRHTNGTKISADDICITNQESRL